MVMALYNLIRALLIAGAVMALVFVALCLALAIVAGAVVLGATSKRRTIPGTLLACLANADAAVELVKAQRPSR